MHVPTTYLLLTVNREDMNKEKEAQNGRLKIYTQLSRQSLRGLVESKRNVCRS